MLIESICCGFIRVLMMTNGNNADNDDVLVRSYSQHFDDDENGNDDLV